MILLLYRKNSIEGSLHNIPLWLEFRFLSKIYLLRVIIKCCCLSLRYTMMIMGVFLKGNMRKMLLKFAIWLRRLGMNLLLKNNSIYGVPQNPMNNFLISTILTAQINYKTPSVKHSSSCGKIQTQIENCSYDIFHPILQMRNECMYEMQLLLKWKPLEKDASIQKLYKNSTAIGTLYRFLNLPLLLNELDYHFSLLHRKYAKSAINCATSFAITANWT